MEKLKVGDILWRMHGYEKNGAVEWHAVPMCIEKVDDHKFLDGSNCGGSWNSIGKNYFLTREECLKDFEKSPGFYEALREPPEPEEPRFGDTVPDNKQICDEDGIVQVFYGLDRQRVHPEVIPWKTDPDTEYGAFEVVTLGEIRDAVERKYRTEFVTVLVEGLMRGVIYECGNYSDNKFRLHGETMGYA